MFVCSTKQHDLSHLAYSVFALREGVMSRDTHVVVVKMEKLSFTQQNVARDRSPNKGESRAHWVCVVSYL